MSKKRNRRKQNSEVLTNLGNATENVSESVTEIVTEELNQDVIETVIESVQEPELEQPIATEDNSVEVSPVIVEDTVDTAIENTSEENLEDSSLYADDGEMASEYVQPFEELESAEVVEDAADENLITAEEAYISQDDLAPEEEYYEESEAIDTYEIEEDKSHELKKYDQNGFAKFSGDIITGVGSFLRKNLYVVIAAAAVIVVILVAIIFINRNKNTDNILAGPSDNSISESAAASESSNNLETIPEEALATDAYENVNSLVAQYFAAMQSNDVDTLASIGDGYIDSVEKAKIQVKAQYVESYQNIVCYTKPGPYDSSYIVYVKYDVKLKDWEQMAPSLLTLVVCSRDDGSLYVYTGEFDENIANYIRTISSQDDVVDLITKVDAEYKEVLDSNIELADYMSALNQTIKNEIGELLASAIAAENQESNVSENEATEDGQVAADNPEVEGTTEETEEPENKTFEVKATTTVNVRMSDSEDADKLGKVQGGTVLTCYEERPNGWSQVEYEGKTAYIKTEFLERVGGEGTPADESQAQGKVKVTDTVKIRESASTDGNTLAIAYQGEEFSLLENLDNGWSKIIYNGKEAYVKTEFVE